MRITSLVVSAALFSGACATNPETDQDEEALSTRYGVDYSFARPSPASLKADGYSFVARYLSNVPAKNLSHAEADALIAAGLDVVDNWEQDADDALSGYSRGASDAQTANAQAAADGAPATRPIYFSIDFDASVAQQGTINDYFDGVASVIGRDRTGAYGGYYPINRLFNAGKITWAWQTYAWSGSMWDPRAQLRQIQNGILGDEADKDQSNAVDFGQWGHPVSETGPTPAAPAVPTACGVISAGHGLSRGQSWHSCDARFELAMQTDGNLVLYSFGVAMWASHTNGASGGDIAIMQTDGNLVVYDPHSHPLWASGTSGHAGARLAIQDDGNAVVYIGSNAIWTSSTGGLPPGPTACGAIEPNHGLAPGEAVHSCDGRYDFVQQGDGNLVLYHGATALWSSRTNGTTARRAIMQSDGNLVVYDPGGALWSSGTSGHAGASLAIQDDGNVVIYLAGHPLWNTGTNGQ